MLLKTWFYSTAWVPSCCSFDPTKARTWLSCAHGCEKWFCSYRHVGVYMRLSRWGRICRERHRWMPQSQILSDVKVNNLTGASSSWNSAPSSQVMTWCDPRLCDCLCLLLCEVWEELNQHEQSWPSWGNQGNGSSVYTWGSLDGGRGSLLWWLSWADIGFWPGECVSTGP